MDRLHALPTGTFNLLMLCNPETANGIPPMRLLNVKMRDASRLFAALPARRPPDVLRDHLAGLAESGAAGMVGSAFDAWIEFTYRGQAFSVNTVNDEYWFFADDESCPDAILEEVVRHAGRCLGGRSRDAGGAVAPFLPLPSAGEGGGEGDARSRTA